MLTGKGVNLHQPQSVKCWDLVLSYKLTSQKMLNKTWKTYFIV